ncbi:hypothetical protein ABZ990_23085 [Streptomyces sp. NPDC046203]|uniref:scabin-related ADP-ribosyltransferase n=1 Tax=Streptomyces sp. NPDC046203 TaxID=3154602 RepID=UPI0033EB1CEB
MAIAVSEELNNLFYGLLGEKIFQASEDLAYLSRRPFRYLADAMYKLSDLLEESVHLARRVLPPGVAEQYVGAVKSLTDDGGTNHLVAFAQQLEDIAEGRVKTSMDIAESKIQLVIEAVILLIELAVLAVMTFFSGGATAGKTAIAKARSRARMLLIMQTLVRRSHLMPTLSEALEEAFSTFAARLALIITADPGRKPHGFDLKNILMSGATGAVNSLFEHVFHGGKSLFKGFFKDTFDKGPGLGMKFADADRMPGLNTTPVRSTALPGTKTPASGGPLSHGAKIGGKTAEEGFDATLSAGAETVTEGALYGSWELATFHGSFVSGLNTQLVFAGTEKFSHGLRDLTLSGNVNSTLPNTSAGSSEAPARAMDEKSGVPSGERPAVHTGPGGGVRIPAAGTAVPAPAAHGPVDPVVAPPAPVATLSQTDAPAPSQGSVSPAATDPSRGTPQGTPQDTAHGTADGTPGATSGGAGPATVSGGGPTPARNTADGAEHLAAGTTPPTAPADVDGDGDAATVPPVTGAADNDIRPAAGLLASTGPGSSAQPGPGPVGDDGPAVRNPTGDHEEAAPARQLSENAGTGGPVGTTGTGPVTSAPTGPDVPASPVGATGPVTAPVPAPAGTPSPPPAGPAAPVAPATPVAKTDGTTGPGTGTTPHTPAQGDPDRTKQGSHQERNGADAATPDILTTPTTEPDTTVRPAPPVTSGPVTTTDPVTVDGQDNGGGPITPITPVGTVSAAPTSRPWPATDGRGADRPRSADDVQETPASPEATEVPDETGAWEDDLAAPVPMATLSATDTAPSAVLDTGTADTVLATESDFSADPGHDAPLDDTDTVVDSASDSGDTLVASAADLKPTAGPKKPAGPDPDRSEWTREKVRSWIDSLTAPAGGKPHPLGTVAAQDLTVRMMTGSSQGAVPRMRYIHEADEDFVSWSAPGRTVWRNTGEEPGDVFRDGFRARNPSNVLDIVQWVTAPPEEGAQFVSTTRDEKLLKYTDRRYQYEIRSTDSGVDVPMTLDSLLAEDPSLEDDMPQLTVYRDDEKEVAFVGGIPAEAVVSVYDRETDRRGRWNAATRTVEWSEPGAPLAPPQQVAAVPSLVYRDDRGDSSDSSDSDEHGTSDSGSDSSDSDDYVYADPLRSFARHWGKSPAGRGLPGPALTAVTDAFARLGGAPAGVPQLVARLDAHADDLYGLSPADRHVVAVAHQMLEGDPDDVEAAVEDAFAAGFTFTGTEEPGPSGFPDDGRPALAAPALAAPAPAAPLTAAPLTTEDRAALERAEAYLSRVPPQRMAQAEQWARAQVSADHVWFLDMDRPGAVERRELIGAFVTLLSHSVLTGGTDGARARSLELARQYGTRRTTGLPAGAGPDPASEGPVPPADGPVAGPSRTGDLVSDGLPPRTRRAIEILAEHQVHPRPALGTDPDTVAFREVQDGWITRVAEALGPDPSPADGPHDTRGTSGTSDTPGSSDDSAAHAVAAAVAEERRLLAETDPRFAEQPGLRGGMRRLLSLRSNQQPTQSSPEHSGQSDQTGQSDQHDQQNAPHTTDRAVSAPQQSRSSWLPVRMARLGSGGYGLPGLLWNHGVAEREKALSARYHVAIGPSPTRPNVHFSHSALGRIEAVLADLPADHLRGLTAIAPGVPEEP